MVMQLRKNAKTFSVPPVKSLLFCDDIFMIRDSRDK